MRNDVKVYVKVYYLPYFWWSWEITVRQNDLEHFNLPYLSIHWRYRPVTDNNEKWYQSVLPAIFLLKLRNYCLSNWPKHFLIFHISVTIEDTDLWLITMRNDVKVHYLLYFWWSWEITVCQIVLANFWSVISQ